MNPPKKSAPSPKEALLIRKQTILRSAEKLLIRKQYDTAALPLFQWAWLKRKLVNIGRFYRKKWLGTPKETVAFAITTKPFSPAPTPAIADTPLPDPTIQMREGPPEVDTLNVSEEALPASPALNSVVEISEPPPLTPAEIEKELGATEKKIRLTKAQYYRLQSILLDPPFFCGKALSLRIYLYFVEIIARLNPDLRRYQAASFLGQGSSDVHSFNQSLRHFYLAIRQPSSWKRYILPILKQCWLDFIYSRLVTARRTRLGVLHQRKPRPMRLEKFPVVTLPDRDLPTISIVTPSYGQAHFIERTLRSVLEQSYPSLEYHVQDGGSQDGTVDVLKRYESRLKSWESVPDKGQSDAIIKGFMHTSGEIMAWLNSDDIIMPGVLRWVGEYFVRNPDVDVVYGHRVLIDNEDREVGRWFLPEHNNEVLRWADYIPQETLFWRRRAWEKVGGLDPEFHFALDWDLLLRFQNEGLIIRRLPYFMGCFRVHAEQKTSALINSRGQKEMNILRRREIGGEVTQREVDENIRPFLFKSGLSALLWNVGIRS